MMGSGTELAPGEIHARTWATAHTRQATCPQERKVPPARFQPPAASPMIASQPPLRRDYPLRCSPRPEVTLAACGLTDLARTDLASSMAERSRLFPAGARRWNTSGRWSCWAGCCPARQPGCWMSSAARAPTPPRWPAAGTWSTRCRCMSNGPARHFPVVAWAPRCWVFSSGWRDLPRRAGLPRPAAVRERYRPVGVLPVLVRGRLVPGRRRVRARAGAP
jgi:hypothetical protein